MGLIWKFKDDKELNERQKYWQHVLGLDNWIIKSSICEEDEMTLSDSSGECQYNYTIKCATIRMINPRCLTIKRIAKYCAELTLVHELLHCKFSIIENNSDFEQKIQHGLIEDIAKALIFAKYNIELKDLRGD